MKRFCQGHGHSKLSCPYFAEFYIVCPDNCKHTINVCGNCWHGMYKWYGWQVLTEENE